MSTPTSPRRKVDPQRRQRVIEGALEAIAMYGVEGLTHRRVAEVASVSLSATTYYFTSLEDLLEEAMREAATQDVADLRKRFENAATADDVPPILASYVHDAATVNRDKAVVIVELYVAVLRRESLREPTAAWEQAWFDVLEPLLGKPRAMAVHSAMAGLVRGALMHESERDEAAIAAVIRGIMHPAET